MLLHQINGRLLAYYEEGYITDGIVRLAKTLVRDITTVRMYKGCCNDEFTNIFFTLNRIIKSANTTEEDLPISNKKLFTTLTELHLEIQKGLTAEVSDNTELNTLSYNQVRDLAILLKFISEHGSMGLVHRAIFIGNVKLIISMINSLGYEPPSYQYLKEILYTLEPSVSSKGVGFYDEDFTLNIINSIIKDLEIIISREEQTSNII